MKIAGCSSLFLPIVPYNGRCCKSLPGWGWGDYPVKAMHINPYIHAWERLIAEEANPQYRYGVISQAMFMHHGCLYSLPAGSLCARRRWTNSKQQGFVAFFMPPQILGMAKKGFSEARAMESIVPKSKWNGQADWLIYWEGSTSGSRTMVFLERWRWCERYAAAGAVHTQATVATMASETCKSSKRARRIMELNNQGRKQAQPNQIECLSSPVFCFPQWNTR